MFRLKHGFKNVEKINLPYVKGCMPFPAYALGPPNALGSFHPTEHPDVFIAAVRRGGLAKLTIKLNSVYAEMELLGMNPLKEEFFGDGKHPVAEAFNDGKVSPDGKFFVGTCDWANF